ncbi:MAG: hypothetical protein A3F26_00180 [Candidatus Ryanbacteria bacterium RIFCSPHIGHO2_12_FULL_47_12b]|uniref:Queuine tRNA-ribosyltransferase n=3 Tax=Parcubacteria group TaxID=1794811 RepID=A0A1G2H7D0_9BACT|nr:MAG: hypothetical protein UX74_C0009G0016 [Parcubacteria group bacterium GW2011_GWA2_47_10b]KKU76385.1 MAG: hypothetical protein UY02_C0023G0009 [Candidatus Giovannonibacteria bacterium GW2011_GWB1_47_6b]OGZ46702.1 MAG: hypothetical protein A2844_02195 [Candidatus Ryanbacteria bacterium RIFCSPHIGHO2_01_FULL_48_80]OGZ48047.1 MAG: hypothetical protein A3C83_02780 [Candidatus Ryanbacteria bacterium RIFCSPHIGHO2_02_FULL_47_25]OGZ51364.1 MAG: hypothetical protein A3A29_02005 [Candidatus Ryanbacte
MGFFRIIKESDKSHARLGILRTSHGIVETPAFVPVATQAVFKTLTSKQARETRSQLAIANTFHLHLKPGEKTIKRAGGLGAFMAWPKPLMTDSGGFQIFSLGFGSDFGTGKILKGKRAEKIGIEAQPRRVEITEAGAWFRSIVDGTRLFIGPKESMKIQSDLGADIIFAFDECTSPIAGKAYTKKSLERSHRWAELSLAYHSKKQKLFGIIQGGKYKDLRKKSARFIGALPFDGFGIGGEFGDSKKNMMGMISWVLNELPPEKPRHLLGIGHPDDIKKIIRAGIDLFDCIAPTHYARRGFAFTSRGRLDMRKISFLADRKPLDSRCKCDVCRNYSRAYITHLMRSGEITGMSLLTMHNLYYFNTFVEEIRRGIRAGRI